MDQPWPAFKDISTGDVVCAGKWLTRPEKKATTNAQLVDRILSDAREKGLLPHVERIAKGGIEKDDQELIRLVFTTIFGASITPNATDPDAA